MAAQPPYDHAGPSVRASEEVNGLLRDQGKIRQQFSGLLGATGIGRGAGSLPAELYWELLDANDQGVVTLGASYSRGGAGGTYQSADVLYYASGGYYVALTLHQLWPVTVDGKPSTLVWRGDMISSAELGIAARRRTAGFGISDDEKYHQSCYALSPQHQRRPVNE